jgi:hypothetical protein
MEGQQDKTADASLSLMSIEDLKAEIKRLEGRRSLHSSVDEVQACYAELSKRLEGTKVRCRVPYDYTLTEGEVYDFVAIEAGIFSTPYVTIRKEDGRTVTGHDYRFETILPDGKTERIIPDRWAVA